MVVCSSIAEDVTQNAFLKIWLNFHVYEEVKGSVYTWMISIARNEAIDYLRSKYARIMRLTVPVLENDVKEHVAVYSRLDYNHISKALCILPAKDRIILELYSMGFTCREIAGRLGLPEGSLKTRMRISYKKLRVYLTGLN